MWKWIRRHPRFAFVPIAVTAAVVFALTVAVGAYNEDVATIPPGLAPAGRARMEFHAWETAHFGFWAVLLTEIPYLAVIILVGCIALGFTRSRN